jgi:predicted dehydrogenase
MKAQKADKKPHKERKLSRRKFLNYSAVGVAGFTILPSWTIGGVRIPPSDRVVVGFIGLGRQGLGDFRGFAGCPGVQVAACCDVDMIKQARFTRRVHAWQRSLDMPERCDAYEFYQDLLERKDIDAVEVVTPDPWHALITIAACQSGKDVYCQKPLAYTITEGLAMVKAVRDHKRVLQVGSQQRSGKEFQKAIALVQAGAIGHIEKIHVRVGDPPVPFDLPKERIPQSLNWNQWMGPLNDAKIHYHPDLCPPISLDPEQNEKIWGAWRWYRETGNGYTSDWGAHMFDIAQAAIGMDGSGPVEFIPKGYQGTPYSTMKYANGIVMTEQPYLEDNEDAKGVKFIGTNGWIEVARGYLACSDPSKVPADLAGHRPLSSAEIKKRSQNPPPAKRTDPRPVKRTIGVSDPHKQNFVDCVRSRKDPIAPVEVGCSTNTLCCLVNMAHELERPVKWNPATLRFVNDKEAEAHRLYSYKYWGSYSLY